MQMQSFRLVTECCTVAGKILRGGGAPMDMDNFKMMVKQSMAKLNSGKLPSAIKKTYKTKASTKFVKSIHFSSSLFSLHWIVYFRFITNQTNMNMMRWQRDWDNLKAEEKRRARRKFHQCMIINQNQAPSARK